EQPCQQQKHYKQCHAFFHMTLPVFHRFLSLPHSSRNLYGLFCPLYTINNKRWQGLQDMGSRKRESGKMMGFRQKRACICGGI
ncbi:MAG: hypothetical protein IIW12_04250, partial [Oscillospiraceae bacterium]|nr:hypothetical protein [Oscillospiraceae bacterium]